VGFEPKPEAPGAGSLKPAARFDVVIVGAGHNGLVAATVLARAGLRALVVEASDRIGGAAVSGEIAPGFTCSTLAHRANIDPGIMASLELERHGLRVVSPEAVVTAPTLDGRALTLWRDVRLASTSVAAFSPRDAEAYPAFLASVRAVGAVLRSLMSSPAPDIDHLSAGDLFPLIRTTAAFRSLAKIDAYRLLRWTSMPASDFVCEWFESEPLRATVAAAGLLGGFAGPRSAGTTAALLWLGAGADQPIAPGWTALGGIGAVTGALAAAARAAGVEIRTGSRIVQILVKDEVAAGVVLDNGDEIRAAHVLSTADPRRTMLTLVDPVHLPPEPARRIRNIRMRGTMTKINYAVSALPAFPGLKSGDDATRQARLGGVIRLAEGLDGIERAFDAVKYGRCSDVPWIEMAVPTLADPSLAPSGAHVVSAYVQFAPLTLRDSSWDVERSRFADVATATIESYAPGFARSVLARQVITPLDLQETYGLTGGHIFHGEIALDQLFVGRPTLGWSRHQTPIPGLFLGGAGTHPGGGLDGRSGWQAARAVLRAIGK
jgi:phytoene dehydrogenase-like protein